MNFNTKISVVITSLFFLSINAILVKQAQAAPSCTTHTLDWSEHLPFNGDINTTYPFTETATNIDSSSLNITVTMPRAGRDFGRVGTSATTFPVVGQYMDGNTQVYRYWKQDDTTIDTLTYNFSEDLTLNKFMFGGHRPGTDNFAYAELTFWDDENGTGNKVLSKHPSGAGSAVVLAATGDATTSAINILPISEGDNYPSTFLSTENSYTMVTYDAGIPRPWTVLDMNGAVVRSMTWKFYGSSVDVSPKLAGSGSNGDESKDVESARNSVVAINVSAYVGNFNFDVCEKVAIGNLIFLDNGDGSGTENDGIRNGSEPSVSGVKTELYDSGNNLVSTEITDANGRYYFDNIGQGDYYVKIPASEFVSGKPLDGYRSSTGADSGISDDTKENGIDDADPVTNGIKSNIFSLAGNVPVGEEQIDYPGTLPDANVNATNDFGFVLAVAPITTVKIGNLVWIETDNDGNATNGTNTFPPTGTVVTATATSDSTTYTGTTNASGNYLIEVPQNDTYTIAVGTPAGTESTLGSTDNNVPDASTENNKSHDGSGTTVVVTTVDNLTLDFGFTPSAIPTVKIGNLIWIETDNDGNATNGTNTFPPAGTLVTATASGGAIYTATTNAAGIYSIDIPQNNTYTVTVNTPSGTNPTLGSTNNDSVPDTSTENNQSHDGSGTEVTVTTVDNLTLDFGFTLPAGGGGGSGTPPPSSGSSTPNPIPTLSEWALILLTIMLGFVGYRHGHEKMS
jgi:hypothetical protein